MTPPRTVSCPQCGAAVVWEPQSLFRPFCSERCRKLDLGAWASDGYRIAGSAPPDDFAVPESMPTPRE